MKKFKQVVIVDPTGLRPWALNELSEYSERPVRMHDTIPSGNDEIIQRIGDADCVLVSWNSRIDAEVLTRCKQLVYVGMCCSLYSAESANVDIATANNNGIVVKGIRDYGDEGVVEFVISQMIQLFKGVQGQQWQEEPVELSKPKVGIIGLGTVGRMLADRLQAFGTSVCYYSRTRKESAENAGIEYLPLSELLERADVVTTHLPRNTIVLNAREFKQFGDGKILVNTSLGVTFDQHEFSNWVKRPGNFAIFDEDGAIGIPSELLNRPNIAYSPIVAGWTSEAKDRLSTKVLDNIKAFHAG